MVLSDRVLGICESQNGPAFWGHSGTDVGIVQWMQSNELCRKIEAFEWIRKVVFGRVRKRNTMSKRRPQNHTQKQQRDCRQNWGEMKAEIKYTGSSHPQATSCLFVQKPSAVIRYMPSTWHVSCEFCLSELTWDKKLIFCFLRDAGN